jgi:hypothetical protein
MHTLRAGSASEYESCLWYRTDNKPLTLTETNAPAGVESTATFVDDYTLTRGPPGTNGRYYRVRWAGP